MNKKEKTAFIMGFSVGLAVFILLLIIYIGGSYAIKNNYFQMKISDEKITLNENDNIDTKIDEENSSQLLSVNDLDVSAGNQEGIWIRGGSDARVTITEYSDLQCPYCAMHHSTLKQIMLEYPNLVKWEYKHFPLDSIHPLARKSAEAAECAGEQNLFWEYIDLLYANQKSINNDIFVSVAKKLGMNVAELSSCIDSGRFKQKVSDDLAEGRSRGVKGTPGNFINGTELKGTASFDQIKELIEKELNK